jgi:hypothetical protein
MKVICNVLITFNALFFAFTVLSMKFCAYILPGCGSENITIGIDNSGRKGVDFIQPILKHLKLFNVDQILNVQRHENSAPLILQRKVEY